MWGKQHYRTVLYATLLVLLIVMAAAGWAWNAGWHELAAMRIFLGCMLCALFVLHLNILRIASDLFKKASHRLKSGETDHGARQPNPWPPRARRMGRGCFHIVRFIGRPWRR